MQEFTYSPLPDGTLQVVGYCGDEAEVVVPETCGGRRITVLGDRIFRGHGEITSVRIPDGVTDLGEFLFDGCLGLRHIALPSSLTDLWGYTFVRCGLEEITLPDSLTGIPPFAFKDCKSLRRVVCGAGMRRIYSWAFGGCDSLEEFICPKEAVVSPEAFLSKEPKP